VYDGKLVIVNSEFDKSGSSWIVASLATSTASMPSRAHPRVRSPGGCVLCQPVYPSQLRVRIARAFPAG
jgi:hypothetical protein